MVGNLHSRCQSCWTRIPVGDRFCPKCAEIHKQSEDCESTEDKLYRFQDLYLYTKDMLESSVKAQESLQKKYTKLKEDCNGAEVFMTQEQFENYIKTERNDAIKMFYDEIMRGEFRLSKKAVLEIEKIKKRFCRGLQ